MKEERKHLSMPQSSSQQRNSIRIIAGEYRSRKLEFPSLEGLRPTADRIRETLFNWLQDSIQSQVCLDLFAGSGALGFEALSRGARQVDFIEKSNDAAKSIRTNIERLGAKQGRVYCADALKWLAETAPPGEQYGLVFLDPPFKDSLLANAIASLEGASILQDGCLVYIEEDVQSQAVDFPVNWAELKTKKAGSVRYGLYQVTRN